MTTQERLGAASGIVAAILFGVAFIIFLGMDPTGTPRIPDVANAEAADAFIDAHENALQAQLLLNSVGIVLFLWFLGSLWATLRASEGGPARVSAIASAGGIVGVAAVLMGFVFAAAALLNHEQGADVTTLYTLDVLSLGLGGAAFTVYFLGVGKVILQKGALPAVIGLLALVAAATSALGFVTIFADDGIFNGATGAIGYWVRFGVFVVWVFLASVALTAKGGSRTRRT